MSERSEQLTRVVVIGAGLSGLAAAQRVAERCQVARRAIDLKVLDARERVGGAIWTNHRDGFTLEGGADSFITNKPQALELCKALGLEEQLLETDHRFRRSFVVRQGRLIPVPEGFVLMAPQKLWPLLTSPILSWRGKLRMMLDLVLPRRGDHLEESLAAFVRRRLGREALDRLVQPLIAGIYTADPNELSLQATLPRFIEMERTHGSLIRAALREARTVRASERGSSGARYGLFLTLADGMGTLPAALAAALPAGTVQLGTAVRRVTRARADAGTRTVPNWRVELLDGPSLEADLVILATEAHAAARLLDGEDPALALHLRSIPYASSAIVNMAYQREQIAHPLDGFGAVVPAIEGRQLLAVSFTSIKFPRRAPEGTVLMRAFLGGATQPELFDRDDDALIDLTRQELAEFIGASGEPLFAEVSRHARAMPQYTLGHLERVAKIEQLAGRHRGLILTGNAFHGVGIPDCIRTARAAADAALAALNDRNSRAVA